MTMISAHTEKGKTMREKLIELLQKFPFKTVGDHADYLIANGVTIPVMCDDCKHFTEGMAIGMCKRNPDKPIIPMPYNAFCSFGERKDNG